MYIPHTTPPGVPLKRQFTGNPSRDTNITIGIIVAIVLTTFIAGVAFFMYRYRTSIRFSRRRKHKHRRKSTGSSRSGRSAAGEEPLPPPPGAPPPEG
ncbi:hypothetical protein IMZ48_07425 [Candidatus Bathyarchaeota archaeon]|nr:hypothetical protein [Candidatus Bathyarchaeota archaeon]